MKNSYYPTARPISDHRRADYLRPFLAVLLSLFIHLQAFSGIGADTKVPMQYKALQETGNIGMVAGRRLDAPSDNYFTIPVDHELGTDRQVWLTCQVKGIAPEGVALRINHRLSTGGLMVKKQQEWQTHRTQIHPDWLIVGNNTVTFTVPEGADHGYQVKEVNIEVVEAPTPELVINTVRRSHADNVYVQGLVADPAQVDQLWIGKELVNVHDHEFERLIASAGEDHLTFKMVLADGTVMTKTAPVTSAAGEWEARYPFANKAPFRYETVSPEDSAAITYGSASLNIPAHTFTSPHRLALVPLGSNDMIALEAGMSNVTKAHSGYKVFGLSGTLEKAVTVKIPYDRTKIPAGYTEKDIRTYAFDYTTGHWTALELDSINTDAQFILSATTNPDNDMINGVIKTPESPESQGYTPTMFSDMKAADPTAKLQIIQPPSVNPRGSAGVQYGIELPPGRNGMQPGVGIQYNSDGGNGWLGVGWDMPVPTISVETRWGVPRYRDDIESETYNMDGAMLAGMHNGAPFVAHKGNPVPREADRQFYKRLGGGFEKIIRRGTDPTNYHWEVTDKGGTIYYYGGKDGVDPDAVLRDPADGHIAAWYLTEVRELHGNFMTYRHEAVTRDVRGLPAVNVYCTELRYTGFGSSEGPYTVRFVRDTDLGEPARVDQRSSANYGFLTVESDLLRTIEVAYDGEMIRTYGLDYEVGPFYKTLLRKITHYDASGNEFNHHDLEYYDDVQSDSGYQPFDSSTENWNTGNDNIDAGLRNPTSTFSGDIPALGGGKTSSRGFSIYAGIGLPGPGKIVSKGASYSRSKSTTKGLITMADINGDGLADKIMDRGDRVTYRPNLSAFPGAPTTFGKEITIKGIRNFSRVTSRSTSRGRKNFLSIFFSGSERGRTSSKTTIYFSDVNGDGLMDLVDNGRVYFNHIVEEDGDLVPTFTLSSSNTPSPIIAGGIIDISDTKVDPAEQDSLIKDSPLHDVVRVWKSPFNGTVDIEAPVRLMAPEPGYDSLAYELADGVRVAIQVRGTEPWSTTIAKGDFSEKMPSGVTGISVNRGDLIYFRVQAGMDSIANGNFDAVTWDPLIRYRTFPDSIPADDERYRYQASEAHLITLESGSAYVPDNQRVSITGQLIKPVTSDDVIVRIKNVRADTIVFEQTYPWDTVVNDSITIPDINVVADSLTDTELSFQLITDSNIDWKSLIWNPILVVDSTAKLPVVADRSILADHRLKAPDYTLTDTLATALKIRPYLMFDMTPVAPSDTTIVMTIKKADTLVGKLILPITVVDTTIAVSRFPFIDSVDTKVLVVPDTALIVPVERDTAYQIVYSIRSTELANLLKTGEMDRPQAIMVELDSITSTDTLAIDTVSTHVYTTETERRFGSLYRHWGQFVYNGMEGRSTRPIREDLLKLPESEDAGLDPVTDILVLMVSDSSATKWQGYEQQTYIDEDIIRTGRLGENDVVLTNPLAALELPGSGASAPVKVTRSQSRGSIKGIGIGPVNGSQSNSGGSSELLSDFMDLNGDRYPDIITRTKIQFTNTKGGFDGDRLVINGHHKSINNSTSYGVGGKHILSRSSTTSEPETNQTGQGIPGVGGVNDSESGNLTNDKAINDSKVSLLPSGGVSSNNDETVSSWVDINGDGLPDKVLENEKVRLNLGYKFSDAVSWDIDIISSGRSRSLSLGLGLGFDALASSYSGGFGLNRSNNKTQYQLMDINSDGLTDRVRIGDSVVYVSLNQGITFADEQIWSGINGVNESSSTGESANLAFTFNIPIPTPFIPLRIAVNPGGNAAKSANRNLVALRDMDADGYLDFVSSDDDSELTVKRSTIARTNRLKTVSNPLGGSFDINYAHNEATYDHPGGKWVMASVTVKDGLYDDGEDMKTVFAYREGKYDRHERAFLGFGEVIAQSIDTEVADNPVYRKASQSFDVDNYYRQGNLLKEQLMDSTGNVFTQNDNTYYQFELTPSGDTYPRTAVEEVARERGIAYTPVRTAQTQSFEGGPNSVTLTQSDYTYGSYGELLNYNYTDKGNLAPGVFNYQTNIRYTDNLSNYLLSLPVEVTVTDGAGTLQRKTNAAYDPATGDMLQIRQTLNAAGEAAVTDMAYDKYGNITKKTLPENHKGERMFYDYRYEGTVNTYVSRIEDAFGYLTRYDKYDFRYGQLLQSESINGYFTNYEIDDLGRLTNVQGPNEEAKGIDYTLKFQYAPIATVDSAGITQFAHAVTQHYDPEYPDDPLETVTFVDGLGRAIQVKKDATITTADATGTPADEEVMIVSGRVKYDAFGRASASYYPTTAPLDDRTIFSGAFDGITPTVTAFDVLDRPLTTTLPDGAVTTMNYAVDTTTNTLFTQVTDALGNRKGSYTNGSGLTTKVEEYSGPAGTITTTYAYDGINQLRTVTDTEGNVITSAYDLAGRRTAVDHPDAGTTRFTYDPLSNMIARQTANLALNGTHIDYAYEYGRLTDIIYPDHPINNVRYYYGDRNAKGNQTGRLLLQEDATGGQEFFYDRLGNLEKQVRTIVIPNNAVATFVTRWRYDTWNRLQEMIYPDQEKLSFAYNKGGLLQGVTGEKTFTYDYLSKLGYDKFEQRTYLKYCNGSETFYTYEPARRRLSNLKVWSGAGFEGTTARRNIMDNAYTYDAVSNVLGVTNNAPIPANGDLAGGQMQHSYTYDGLYRLQTAAGTYTGFNSKQANYTLTMSYDNLHNITGKKQDIAQTDIQFDGLLQAGYDLSYTYGDQPHQLDNLGEAEYRTDAAPADGDGAATAIAEATKTKDHGYDYDPNGNLVYINTSAVDTKENERKLRWDEENRLHAVDYSGFISSYTYDAGGERVVKSSGNSEGMYVNSLFSGARTQTNNYTVYVNPFMVIRNGGSYTKHFYIGGQRIVSKLGDFASFGEDPRRIEYAGEGLDEDLSIDYAAKYTQSQAVIKGHYDAFEVPYHGKDNNDYKGGTGFCCDPAGGRTAADDDSDTNPWGAGDTPETLQYFYHPDHLGSASYITNLDGEVSQHIEYVPFGEVFIEERNNTWNTPYLFNGKELDEETGLYYYGARYYNPKTSLWLSVDPLAEKMPGWSPYNYTLNNPVLYVDPDGRYPIITITKQKTGKTVGQRVLGYSGGRPIQADLYKAIVTDTEDKNFKIEFSMTRDAWTVESSGDKNAKNVAFEPKDGEINHFTGKVMKDGYPQDNGTEALKLTQYGSEVMHAEANETSVKMGYRDKKDVAKGIMIHVGGVYEKNGKTRTAASEGCFGIVNPNNSETNPSNNYSNSILNKIKNQASKSKTNPNHIRVIIQKREGNEFPKTKNLD